MLSSSVELQQVLCCCSKCCADESIEMQGLSPQHRTNRSSPNNSLFQNRAVSKSFSDLAYFLRCLINAIKSVYSENILLYCRLTLWGTDIAANKQNTSAILLLRDHGNSRCCHQVSGRLGISGKVSRAKLLNLLALHAKQHAQRQ